MSAAQAGDRAGGAWLLADMALNVWALSIVKALGLDYPAAQLVFLRAAVGLVILAPWIAARRRAFRTLPDWPLHLLRVALSAATLTLSFYAIARVPLALFTAVGFTRPLVTMAMVAVALGEPIGRRRWIAAGVALAGVVVAVGPDSAGLSPGLVALFGVVLTGSAAVAVTRRLSAAPVLVLMTAYAAGLTALLAPVAAVVWVPVRAEHWVPLLAIGVFAQSAQLCFLRAHALARAGFLSVLGYLSLVVSTLAGWLVFGEVPAPAFFAGAVLVVGAAAWVTLERPLPRR